MKLPVYLFTGFLEGGKTTIIQESLNDQNFNSGEKTLVILCEEGIEELDASKFWGQNVSVVSIDSEEEFTKEKLLQLTKNKKLDRVIVEYNGMWLLDTFYKNIPETWGIYQNMMFADANTFIAYNNNMRQLVYDKLKDAEMIVLNRTPSDIDKEEIHKIVRGVTRRAAIVYDYPDGHVEYDEIEDPLPFDVNADTIEIADEDYALWYRDLTENLSAYEGKTVKFKGLVAKNDKVPKGSFVIGRPLMTCCADDIQYAGLVCDYEKSELIANKSWVMLTADITLKKHKAYQSVGPVLEAVSVAVTSAPEKEVAEFY